MTTTKKLLFNSRKKTLHFYFTSIKKTKSQMIKKTAKKFVKTTIAYCTESIFFFASHGALINHENLEGHVGRLTS